MDFLNGIGFLILYAIIFFSILLYIVIIRNRKNIIDNWAIYRCNPIIMPFAGFFGKDIDDNFQGCLYTSTEGFFGILIKPFHYIMSLFVKIIGDLYDNLNVLRNFLEPVREFVAFGSDMVYRKVEGLMNVVIYSFLKIQNLMKRVFANFRLAVYSLEASQMAINSTWEGPIGGLVRQWGPLVDFFCFGKDTYINGVPIQDIQIDNDHILGRLTFVAPTRLYNYMGVFVSGNHFVKHNGTWMMIKETGAPVVKYDGKTLHSLITRDHRINFNGIEWADYEETNRLAKFQKKLVLFGLSGQNMNYPIPDEFNLILGDTLILLRDLSWKQISEIRLGDELFPNNRVLGTVQISGEITHHNGIGVGNIVFKNKSWCFIDCSNDTKVKGIHYNLVTQKGYFITPYIIVRDYLEMESKELYEKLSDMTNLILNN